MLVIVNNLIAKLRKIFILKTLRQKIFYTLLMSLVIRLGVHIPIPGINIYKLKALSTKGGLIDFINMLSGGAFSQASIFTLSIIPYINASIIMYILTLIIPKLEDMQKEGGSEKEKISQWTRYLSIGISILHSIFTITYLQAKGLIAYPGFIFNLNTIMILTSSVMFLTWIGDQITTNGIGNGISIIIFLGIVARIPSYILQLFQGSLNNNMFYVTILSIALFGFILTSIIVMFQLAQRKIPVYYASSRSSSISTKSYLPMKINNAGVMPIIFSSIIISAPSSLINFLPEEVSFKQFLLKIFYIGHPFALILYFTLVLFFTFFYTSVIFDPEKIGENLKKSGGVIPGIRPGRETVEYLENIITKITSGGALFLAFIAIFPYIMSKLFGSPFGIGGTGILIAVSVAVELLQQIEGALSMEEYRGFI